MMESSTPCTCPLPVPIIGPRSCPECGAGTAQINGPGGFRVVCVACEPLWLPLLPHLEGCPAATPARSSSASATSPASSSPTHCRCGALMRGDTCSDDPTPPRCGRCNHALSHGWCPICERAKWTLAVVPRADDPQLTIQCEKCGGLGEDADGRTCEQCSGSGGQWT